MWYIAVGLSNYLIHIPESKEQKLNFNVNPELWNNRFIKSEKFSFYYQVWHKAGVIRIKDFFFENIFLINFQRILPQGHKQSLFPHILWLMQLISQKKIDMLVKPI